MLTIGKAYGVDTTGGAERIEEPSGGGLFGSLLNANKKKLFKLLRFKNFRTKVGRAYKIGDMVFIDSMFFDGNRDDEATAAGRAALNHILQGGSFVLDPASDPFAAMMEQQILAMLFFMRATEGMRVVYRLDPKMNEAGDIVGAQSGAPLQKPIALLAFVAALATGQAQPLGDVWQIGDNVVIAAPLEEIFDK
jgi:hypothetical protein